MPVLSYKGKVCCVSLSDVCYGGDFGWQLGLKKLIYYVECLGMGRRINFWFFGDDLKVKSLVGYAYRNYNTKFRKVVTAKCVDWKKFMGSLDDQWCDHVLTLCDLDEFYDNVRVANAGDPVQIPECRAVLHAYEVPADPEDTTVGGRYRPLVPYDVELTLRDEEMNNTDVNTVCLCKL